MWKRCGPFDCEVSRDGKEYIHSRDQEAHAVGTTLIRQCAEMLFCLLRIHSTLTVRNLTHQHLDGHLPYVDVLELHAHCSHISTLHFESARFTLKAHAHRLSDPTSPYPCVYPPPRSFAGTRQARSAFCPVRGNETLPTSGTHSARHIYLYEFHSTHFPASLPPPHTSPNPLLFTAHTHLVKLSFRTPHRHVRVVFVAIHLPSITCF